MGNVKIEHDGICAFGNIITHMNDQRTVAFIRNKQGFHRVVRQNDGTVFAQLEFDFSYNLIFGNVEFRKEQAVAIGEQTYGISLRGKRNIFPDHRILRYSINRHILYGGNIQIDSRKPFPGIMIFPEMTGIGRSIGQK